jgi:hypothetical protein
MTNLFKTRGRVVLMVAVFACLGAVAFGDVTARISGTVKDQSGAVVPGVVVSVVNNQTGIRQTTTSDQEGFYAFLSLAVGHYDLEASHQGFQDFKEEHIVLDVNTALRVDIPLQLGEEKTVVTVSSSALQVETTSTQMGDVITGSQMTSVPLNGRSFTDLLALQPGVSPVSSGQYTGLPVSGDLNPGNLSVSGQREGANGFMVNGANVEEGANMGTAVIPNLDSIGEFRILTNNFDAEYGNYSGGQVNVITKSGTNQFHGDLFDFLRNTDLDARNYFSPDRGTYIQNQFGGIVGGPIRKNKLFFFADYQGTRQIIGQSTGLIGVPSAANRMGDFSKTASSLTGTVSGAGAAAQLSQQLGYKVTDGEPYYTTGCSLNTACVFPNALIPQAAMAAPAMNILKYIPLPNDGAYFSTSAYDQTLSDNKGSFRTDWDSRFGMVSGYYFIDDFVLNTPYAAVTLPGFNTLTDGRAQLASLMDMKTFGSAKVNEFHLSYTRLSYAQNTPSGGLGVSLSSLGFATGPDSLGIVVNDPAAQGVPNLTFSEFSLGVSPYFQDQFNNTYQILDNFTLLKGNHALKFGGGFHYDQITDKDFGVLNGTFDFDGQETGGDFADYLIGAPDSYEQGIQEPLHTRGRYIGLYAQDSWRASSSLTVNYGLRWEVTTPWWEANNQLETIVPGEQSVVFPGAPTGWVFPGDPGVPSTIAPTRYNNFGPRLGLAWSPSKAQGVLGRLLGGANQTSIRAGYGLFHTSFEDATGFVEIGDAPFGFFYTSPVPPQFATPFVDRSTGNSQGQRFPVVFPPNNASPRHPDNSVNWAQFLPISGSPAFFYKNRVPYSGQYFLSLQRQFSHYGVLSASYVGSQSHALLSDKESNPGNQALCLSLSEPSGVAPGSPTCGPSGEDGTYTSAAGQVITGTRPLSPNFGRNKYFITAGSSNYNALQTSFRHESGGLELLAGYTYSKSIDNSSGYADAINPFNPRQTRGLSAFDSRNNFVLSYRYKLPFDSFLPPGRITSGWALSGITRFASGLPVTLTETDDRSLIGTKPSLDLPNYTPGNLQHNNPRSGLPYFNTALFSPETLGQIGNSGRRFFSGPGINNWDMALLKETTITESTKLQFRLEMFNVFNHASFDTPPEGNINSSTFGYVTTAGDPRIGQLALKFLF